MSRMRSRGARRRAWLFALVLATRALGGCKEPGPSVVLHGEKGATRVHVELALTRETQAHGLMWRDELASDAGMLFVFPKATERTFWMKNTPLPLDIIYIGQDKKVVSIAANTTPYSQTTLPSDGPAKYVLEVNAGFSREHGIKPGTAVDLPALPDSKSSE